MSLDPGKLEAVAEEAARARALAPTLADAAVIEAEARQLLGEREEAFGLIQLAAELAPTDATISLRAGFEAVAAGDHELAIDRLRSAVAQRSGYFEPVATALLDRYGQPTLLLELAGDRADWLKQVGRALGQRQQVELAREALERETQARLLAVQQLDGAADGRQLAELASCLQRLGRSSEAAQWYSLAIDMAGMDEPTTVNRWRLERAKVLWEMGNTAGAMSEVERVLRIEPGHAEAQRMKAEWDRLLGSDGG